MSSQVASEKIAALSPSVLGADDLRYLRSLLDEMLDDLRRVDETVHGLRDRNGNATALFANDEIVARE